MHAVSPCVAAAFGFLLFDLQVARFCRAGRRISWSEWAVPLVLKCRLNKLTLIFNWFIFILAGILTRLFLPSVIVPYFHIRGVRISLILGFPRAFSIPSCPKWHWRRWKAGFVPVCNKRKNLTVGRQPHVQLFRSAVLTWVICSVSMSSLGITAVHLQNNSEIFDQNSTFLTSRMIHMCAARNKSVHCHVQHATFT